MTDLDKTTTASMDDIVFEERNQAYGAYQLRKQYTKNFAIAMGIAAAVLGLFIGGYSYSLLHKGEEPPKEVMREVVMEDVALDEETPEPPEMEVPPPKVEQIKFVPFEIKEEVKPDDIPPEQNQLDTIKNISNVTEHGENTDVIVDDGGGNKVIDDSGDDGFLTSVEEDAKFPGGAKAWAKFMQKIDGKPAQKLKAPGKVIVYFEVDKFGTVSGVKILQGFDKACDAEALRVMLLMQETIKWEPAKLNGRPGRVRKKVPIVFTPPSDDEE